MSTLDLQSLENQSPAESNHHYLFGNCINLRCMDYQEQEAEDMAPEARIECIILCLPGTSF